MCHMTNYHRVVQSLLQGTTIYILNTRLTITWISMGPTSDAPVECCRRCTKATVKCKIIVHVDGTQGTGGRSGPVLESQTRAEPNSNDGLHSGTVGETWTSDDLWWRYCVALPPRNWNYGLRPRVRNRVFEWRRPDADGTNAQFLIVAVAALSARWWMGWCEEKGRTSRVPRACAVSMRTVVR